MVLKLSVVGCTGGWNQEPKRIPKAEVVPNEWATPEHFGEGRVRLCTVPNMLAAPSVQPRCPHWWLYMIAPISRVACSCTNAIAMKLCSY